MQNKIETIKGWDIDSSFESEALLKPKHKQVVPEEPSQTKTLSSERKLSPKKIMKTPINRTPLNSIHQEQGSLSSTSLGKLYVKKSYQQKLPPPTPQVLTVSKLKLRLTALPKSTQLPKAYSSVQLNTILQLKRKNMYLQSILKKVNNESDERYTRNNCDQLLVTHNRASQSMWMESTMAMRSFFNTRMGHLRANGGKHKFAV